MTKKTFLEIAHFPIEEIGFIASLCVRNGRKRYERMIFCAQQLIGIKICQVVEFYIVTH